jgi:hypothetical protein
MFLPLSTQHFSDIKFLRVRSNASAGRRWRSVYSRVSRVPDVGRDGDRLFHDARAEVVFPLLGLDVLPWRRRN